MKPEKAFYTANAGSAQQVPVWDEFMVDTETPISIFSKVAAGEDCSYLLESVSATGEVARYSFLGFDPLASVRVKGSLIKTVIDGQEQQSFGNPVKFLKDFVKRFQTRPDPYLPFFPGGAVGYLSYDWVRYLERLPNIAEDDLGIPDGMFYIYRKNLIYDHARNSLKIVVLTQPGAHPEAVYDEATAIITGIKNRISQENNVFMKIIPAPLRRANIPCRYTMNKEEYIQGVNAIKEHIYAGDVFQTVLSTRLETITKASPLEIYRCLRMVNPSPYMFLLRFPEFQLVGASPEMLVMAEKGQLEVRPIAGTRPRGKKPAEDADLAAEMLQDIKERAEHVMLVDLGRNDVGKVSQYGSISVPKFMEVEKYSHVMHMVSSVTGRLRQDKDSIDAFMACFPAGTVSGAPKIRAMEIIENLEPVRRGPYAGAVGYLGLDGSLNTCITIRTTLIKENRVFIQAGAGIVADSDPEKEFQESINKSRALTETLAMAERSALDDISM